MKEARIFHLYDNSTGERLSRMDSTHEDAKKFAKTWCETHHQDVMLAGYNPSMCRWEQLRIWLWIEGTQEAVEKDNWVAPMDGLKFH